MLSVLAVELLSTNSYDLGILRDLLGNAKFEQIEGRDRRRYTDCGHETTFGPNSDGYSATRHDRHETARRIKSSQEMNAIPIIAVIFCALAGDDAKALAAGLQCST